MKRVFLSVILALGLVVGGLALSENKGTAEAGSAYRNTNCWYGEACHITWTSGPGAYQIQWTGADVYGNPVSYTSYSPWCGALNCYRSTLKPGDAGIRWIGVSITGVGYVNIAYINCYPAYGGY